MGSPGRNSSCLMAGSLLEALGENQSPYLLQDRKPPALLGSAALSATFTAHIAHLSLSPAASL